MFFSVVSETLVPGNVSNKKENIMYKKFEMELAGRTLRVDVDRVAKQAMVRFDALRRYLQFSVLATAS